MRNKFCNPSQLFFHTFILDAFINAEKDIFNTFDLSRISGATELPKQNLWLLCSIPSITPSEHVALTNKSFPIF